MFVKNLLEIEIRILPSDIACGYALGIFELLLLYCTEDRRPFIFCFIKTIQTTSLCVPMYVCTVELSLVA